MEATESSGGGGTGHQEAEAPHQGRAQAIGLRNSVPHSLHAVPTLPNLARFILYDILNTRNALKKMVHLLRKTIRRSNHHRT